jgi:hypothetical protein
MGKSQRLVRKFEMVSTIGFTSCVMGYARRSGHELMLRHEKIQITYTDLSSLQYLGGPSGHQRSLSEEWRACWAFLVYGLGHLRPILCELPTLPSST